MESTYPEDLRVMELYIFKTNINTRKKARALKPLFRQHPVVACWTIDTEDIDHVLRVQTDKSLSERDVCQLLWGKGFFCESLPD